MDRTFEDSGEGFNNGLADRMLILHPGAIGAFEHANFVAVFALFHFGEEEFGGGVA